MFDPVQRGDGDGDSFIAFGVVVVRDDEFVHLVDDFPGFLFVDFHIRLFVNPFHGSHQQFVEFAFYYFAHIFQHAAHAEGVLVIRGDERRREQYSVIVRVRSYLSNITHHQLFLCVVRTGQ